jgi:predicted helicase
LNDAVYRQEQYFPTGRNLNQGFYTTSSATTKPFAAQMLDVLPDVNHWGSEAGQHYPRWRYEKVDPDGGMLSLETAYDSGAEVIDGYRRIDNVTDQALTTFRSAYGDTITKDDIFFFVYGLLHSPEYRETYGADLKKMLPRIPLVKDPWPFVEAGRALSELHLGYESVTPYPLEGLDVEGPAGEAAYDFFAVDKKMKFATKGDRSRIVYNNHLTLGGIPEDAYRYMLGSRSAIEWIMDRYWVKTDKASGIVNDPNDWSREVSDPRYIIDLLARIVTVSLETMQIVDALPALDILPDQNPGS